MTTKTFHTQLVSDCRYGVITVGLTWNVQFVKRVSFRHTIYAPVICIPSSLGAGDTGDIVGLYCRNLTSDRFWQCCRWDPVLFPAKIAIYAIMLTTNENINLWICTV